MRRPYLTVIGALRGCYAWRVTNAETVYIGLGSNLGDRAASIEGALLAIERLPDVQVSHRSDLIETAAWGPIQQGPYLNAAAALRTTWPPRMLLDSLLKIEREAGRDRSREVRWGPRRLDLDLLLYGGHIIDEPGLTIPHPRMQERRFVLEPLAQIAPDLVHPVLGLTVTRLLASLPAEAGYRST